MFRIILLSLVLWCHFGLSIHAYGQTKLFAGDVSIVAYDNSVRNKPDDALTLVVWKALSPGTSFSICNAIYEWNEASNVHSNKWYSGNGSPDEGIDSRIITFHDSIPLGSSIVVFIGVYTGIYQVMVNGIFLNPTQYHTQSDGFNASSEVNLSSSAPDAFFIVQGKWTFKVGYANLQGRVLSGLQIGNSWYTDSSDTRVFTAKGKRTSRIPIEIACFAFQGMSSNHSHYGFWNTSYSLSRGLCSTLQNVGNPLAASLTIGTSNMDYDSTSFSTIYLPSGTFDDTTKSTFLQNACTCPLPIKLNWELEFFRSKFGQFNHSREEVEMVVKRKSQREWMIFQNEIEQIKVYDLQGRNLKIEINTKNEETYLVSGDFTQNCYIWLLTLEGGGLKRMKACSQWE